MRCYIDMVIYLIDKVILHIYMGIGLIIWEMTVSMSPVSRWDILVLIDLRREL